MPKKARGGKVRGAATAVKERGRQAVQSLGQQLSPRKRAAAVQDAIADAGQPSAFTAVPPSNVQRPEAFVANPLAGEQTPPRGSQPRRDSAVGDTVIADRHGRGKGKGLDRDWNGAQQVHELKGLRGDFSTFSDATTARMGELAGIARETAEAITREAENTRQDTAVNLALATEAASDEGELTRTAIGERIDAAADRSSAESQLTRNILARRINASTTQAFEDQARLRDQLGAMSRQGAQDRATIIGELRGQRQSLDGAATTLDRILAQGASLSPDAIAAAQQAVETDPSLQQLVNDGMLKWQDLLRPDGSLDMARLAAVRAKIGAEQKRKDAEYTKTFARFNAVETQPGRKSIGNGLNLTFPAMWSNTIR